MSVLRFADSAYSPHSHEPVGVSAALRLWAKHKLVAIVVTVGLGLGAVGALSNFEQVDEIISERLSAAATHTGQDARFMYYVDSLRLLQERPLTGAGPEGFKREVERIVRPELSGLNPVYLHNDVLQIFVEYGVLVGTLVIFAIGIGFWTAPITLKFCFYSLIIFSCFDFPWRIGALIGQCGMLWALAIVIGSREDDAAISTERKSRSGA